MPGLHRRHPGDRFWGGWSRCGPATTAPRPRGLRGRFPDGRRRADEPERPVFLDLPAHPRPDGSGERAGSCAPPQAWSAWSAGDHRDRTTPDTRCDRRRPHPTRPRAPALQWPVSDVRGDSRGEARPRWALRPPPASLPSPAPTSGLPRRCPSRRSAASRPLDPATNRSNPRYVCGTTRTGTRQDRKTWPAVCPIPSERSRLPATTTRSAPIAAALRATTSSTG